MRQRKGRAIEIAERLELDRNEGEKEEEGKREKDNEWNGSDNLASYEIIQYGQSYEIIQYGHSY